MHKAIVVFEVEGGSDKYFNGHRKDTMPIVNSILDAGWHAEVVYFRPEWSEDIFTYVSENFDAYISRVNPGNIPAAKRSTSNCSPSFLKQGSWGCLLPKR